MTAVTTDHVETDIASLSPDTILVGHDGSAGATIALDVAVDLANGWALRWPW